MSFLRVSPSQWLAPRRLLCSLIGVCCLLALSLSSLAQAGSVHPLLGSFGPGGPGAGSFANVESVAVDQSSGSVYVYDSAGGGSVHKFNVAGEPAGFSSLAGTGHPDVIEGVGMAGSDENEIAVDSSSGPAKGDIYVANGAHVGVYSAAGAPLPHELNGEVTSLFANAAWGEPCGVATDQAGNVYIGLYSESVNKYTPTTEQATNESFTAAMSGLSGLCNLAVDGEGNVYSDGWASGPVVRYPAAKFSEPATPGTQVDGSGSTLAVDPSTNDLYIDERNGVAQYDRSGKLVTRFAQEGPGAIGGSFGVALYAPSPVNQKVYVSDPANGTVEIFDTLAVADVSTSEPSSLAGRSVTLNGSVNPDGIEVTSCRFEYGTSASYGLPPAPCSPNPGAGSASVPVSADLSSLEPNTVYHYRLAATDKNGTTTTPDQTFKTLEVAPVIDAQPGSASNVTQFSASLNGTINPGNAPTSYHFLYGPTSSYGSVAPAPDRYLPVNPADDPVTQTVSGLEAGTTYHFALAASSPGGTVQGPDETFTTPSVPPPLANTGPAVEVTRAGAAVTGTVDSMGWDTTYHVQYGTTTLYGANWPTIDTDIGALTGNQPIAVNIENLQPATLYHYRLVATNPGGTSYGTDQTFTTAQYPLSVIQEAPLLAANLGFLKPEATTGKSTSKPLTRVQKLTNALKACKRKPKKQHGQCEKQARARYGPITKKKK
jgi:hypothetical protein